MNRLEQVKKLTIVLPYIPAVILLFFSLSFWRKGYTSGALLFGLAGVGLMVLPILLTTIRKVMGNDRSFIIVLSILVFCFSLRAWIRGEIYDGLFFALMSICLICGQFLYSQKQKGSKWSSRTWQIYIPFAVVLITFGILFYLEYVSENKTPPVGNEGSIPKQVVDKSSKPNSLPMQKMVEIMNRSLPPEQREDPKVQKMMEIIASESFQQQMEQQDPETPEEILQLLAAHGVTEAASININKVLAVNQKRMEVAYKARNPAKDPAKEDDAMAERFAELMKHHGAIGGMARFMRNPENVEWISFRFKDDPEAYTAWKKQVRHRVEMGVSRATSESGERANQAVEPLGVESTPPLQQEIPIGENAPQDTLVELETPIIPDTVDRAKTPPVVDTEKVIPQVSPEPPALPTDEEIETTLSERFSSERFERAMDTLERYGTEEGLRRLRESDPEIAKQMEQTRNRKNREEDY